MMIAKMIGIGRCTSFKTMIGQDTMIVISRIGIDGTIIDKMISTMITREKMTDKMITRGIVVTIMIVTIHQGTIEMIDALTKVIDIMKIRAPMIKGGMMSIGNLINDSMTIDETTIGDPRHLDNSNIILKPEMS